MPVVESPSQTNRVFNFGEFEFSVRALELRKNGELVRLQQQPLRLLLALLEYSGDVITRAEIRERVWPGASVQDFDNSLRVAINKLRQALGDDSENPRYVETLPRRGYRWLYPVSVHEAPHNVLTEELPTDPQGARDGSNTIRNESEPTWVSRGGVRSKSVVFTAVLLFLVVLTGRYLRQSQVADEPKVVPLTTYSGLEYMPSFSPDGHQVAFAWTGPDPTDSYSVYTKRIGEERPHRLTETPAKASDGDPVWSPDGKRVYFFRRGGDPSGIYAAPAEGGLARLVVATSLGGRRLRRCRFDVSLDGKSLAYPDVVAGQDTAALFLLSLDTNQKVQVTNPPANSEGDGDPAFSHDGKYLAYQRNTLDLQQVYIVPATGGQARMLDSNFLTDFIDGLAWTADDREIIFGGRQLRRIPVSGDNPSSSVVSFVPGPALFPVVKGNAMAYVQATLMANIWKLELRDASHASGEPVKLISSTRQQAAAAFSPDGTRVAFQSDRTGNWEIWVSKRDGSDPVQLTHFKGLLAGTPRWSPDSKQIVFDSRESGISQIYAISAAGGEPRQLTQDTAGGEVPSWSRDGKWIYFSTIRDGSTDVYKLPAEGGAPMPVTRDGGIYAVESHDGKYLYFSRNSHDATIWRMPVGGGAEVPVAAMPKPSDCSHWAIAESGIYLIDGTGNLLYYEFANGSVTKVHYDQRFLTDWSMAVSPDGREVVWAQIDDRMADLMLVENFR